MINRILIRSKVVQIAYSYFLTKDKTVMEAEKELFFSFEKSYELYHLLLTLMVELTDTQAARGGSCSYEILGDSRGEESQYALR